MKLLTRSMAIVFLVFIHSVVAAQSIQDKPGYQRYTPTRVEWVALVSNDALQQRMTEEMPFSLNVVAIDHETLLISVDYMPSVSRELMNDTIENARQVIMIRAKNYGWEKWVKIKERVEMVKPKSEDGAK